MDPEGVLLEGAGRAEVVIMIVIGVLVMAVIVVAAVQVIGERVAFLLRIRGQ